MLSHVFLGTNDLSRAEVFYTPILHMLGWRMRFSDHAAGWVGWQLSEADRPLLIVGRPFDGASATPSNGGMIALCAADRTTVDAVFAQALRGGGATEGEPGLRPHYHANYYGAYFRDLDHNKLCVVCHEAPDNGFKE